MSDEVPEFSQHMLEEALEGVTTRILEPLEISTSNEPRTLSEISELSSPSELSDLSTASQLSPEPDPSELFYSSVPSEPTVPVVSSALTQPSVTESSVPSLVIETSIPSLITESLVPSVTESLVPSVTDSLVPSVTDSLVPSVTESLVPSVTEPLVPSVTESSAPSLPSALTLSSVTESPVPSALKESLVPAMPSALTEPSLESLSVVSSSKCLLNTEEQSIHTESRLCFTELANHIPVEISTSSNKKETRLTTIPSSGLTEINGECDLTKAFGNESISTQECQSLPVHNSINDYVDDYQNCVYGTPYSPSSLKCSRTYRPSFLNSKHRPSASTSLFNSRELFLHISNVSEKQRLFKKLDTSDEVFDDGGVLATSSPRNTSTESPADKIVKSVGCGQYISPLSTNGLYPGIEVVDNIINETMPTESENQLSSSKRLNDGSIAMESSTKSFKSSYNNCNDNESIVVKGQCEFGLESSISGISSDHDGPVSQTSNSFTIYQPNNELLHDDVDSKLLACNGCVYSEESQDSKESKVLKNPKERPHTHTFTQPQMQQQLRLANNRLKTEEQYRKEETPKKNYIDDEEEVRALEITAERVAILENTVKEQNCIISKATQALNISDMYRKKNYQYIQCSEYSNDHLYAERLLLIANLKRKDAVLEAQRLRNEHNLSPTGIAGGFRFRPPGNGKRLVIDSLRVPLLTAVTNENNSTKYKPDLGTRNMTKWPQEIRYFVCVIRATATVYQPPMTTATQPIDAMNESIYRFTLNNYTPYNELGYGYVEFINRQNDSFGSRGPDAEGNPIIIDGLDNGEWKITVELYGLYPTECGNSSGNNGVRTTMYYKLAYFMFSSSEVNHQQFTLNKVHQSRGSTSTSKSAVPIVPIDEPEVVRICMQLLEDGEKYVYRHVHLDLNGSILSTSRHEENLVIKSLKLPPECKLTEGFITLFDDFATRIPFKFEQNETPKWQHFLNKNAHIYSQASWTRLWFKLEIINDPNALKNDEDDGDAKMKEIIHPQTVILKYWLYPEHVEQNREPGGIIDLSGCLPLTEEIGPSKPFSVKLVPAAEPFLDSFARPNTVRILFTVGYQIKDANDYPDDYSINDPLLLAFDTLDERDKWCNTINGAVNAIATHQEQFNNFHEFCRKQKLKKR